jgi:hypothetical protein
VFVLLAFVSSAAVSLPLSSDPPARVAALYDQHRGAYVTAQVLGLLGVLMLVVFVGALRRSSDTSHFAVTLTGLATAVAALGTNITVLVLCFDTGLGPAGVHRAAVATDLADDVLFAAFALFALALAASRLPGWLRGLAAGAALLCLARALEPWLSVPGLEAVSAIGVMLVLLAVGLRTARTASPRRLTR